MRGMQISVVCRDFTIRGMPENGCDQVKSKSIIESKSVELGGEGTITITNKIWCTKCDKNTGFPTTSALLPLSF